MDLCKRHAVSTVLKKCKRAAKFVRITSNGTKVPLCDACDKAIGAIVGVREMTDEEYNKILSEQSNLAAT